MAGNRINTILPGGGTVSDTVLNPTEYSDTQDIDSVMGTCVLRISASANVPPWVDGSDGVILQVDSGSERFQLATMPQGSPDIPNLIIRKNDASDASAWTPWYKITLESAIS